MNQYFGSNSSIISSGWRKEDRVARAVIPKELCKEIVNVCENKIKVKQMTLGGKE